MLRLSLALGGVLAVLLLVPPAFGDQPSRDPTPPPPGTSFTLPGICAFDVQVTVTVNKEYTLTFSNGAQIITGALVVKLTNLSTNKSTTLNIAGPGFTTAGSSQLTLSGSSLIFYFPGDLGPGTPGALLWTRGPVTVTFDATGAVTAIDRTSASATDMCKVLS
jgi:uncharacterized protein YaiE (UPF0345 family)